MTAKIKVNSGALPAGRYFVGDLCYVVRGKDWDKLIKRLFPSRDKEVVGIFEDDDGINYAIFATAHGDGQYFDGNGRRYPVDSGSIGCIPECAITAKFNGDRLRELGNIIDFPSAFEVDTDLEAGTITFGHVTIETDADYLPEGEGGRE